MRFVPSELARARWPIGAVLLALTVTGCAPESGASPKESPSASGSTPAPGWADVGGEPVTTPTVSPSTVEGGVEDRRVDPRTLPVSCEATGIEERMSDVVAQLEEPEFTEVRTDTRLECSWAGFDPRDGSEVVMVTFAPEKSLVAYPGHVPVKAQRGPSFFTTDAVAAMGGVAEWDGGEMFSGVKLHLPGMLVSTTSNTPRVETGDLLAAATGTARELMADSAPQEAGDSASPRPESSQHTWQADERTGGPSGEAQPERG
ncbi:hypothetical protein [Streptomonospora litoralis]|uniref:Uncharacterized protein n=1 Tax=Streptomonospora litoralis TaxID=2498135 RepID=A0A4P6Q2N3_9ACTN|nr:hypothetical protein [Streptomonospora litoralis]QBI52907.1 hypothetical protein EKD16_05505 [Streptomonospora litoralis]